MCRFAGVFIQCSKSTHFLNFPLVYKINFSPSWYFSCAIGVVCPHPAWFIPFSSGLWRVLWKCVNTLLTRITLEKYQVTKYTFRIYCLKCMPHESFLTINKCEVNPLSTMYNINYQWLILHLSIHNISMHGLRLFQHCIADSIPLNEGIKMLCFVFYVDWGLYI
jgi:hypothetical protein